MTKQIKRYRLSPESNICWFNHQIDGQYVLPADVYLEMAAVAANEFFDLTSFIFHDIIFLNKLAVNNMQQTVTLELEALTDLQSVKITVSHIEHDKSTILFTAAIARRSTASIPFTLNRIHGDLTKLEIDKIHAQHTLGQFYQTISSFHYSGDAAVIDLQLSSEASSHSDAFLTPLPIINAIFIAAIKFSAHLGDHADNLFIPASVTKLELLGEFTSDKTYQLRLDLRSQTEGHQSYDAVVVDDKGHCLLRAESIQLVLSKKHSNQFTDNAIAIIGAAGRFPDANDIEAFWQNLKNGHCSIKDTCDERWDWDDYHQSGMPVPGKSNCKHGAFITGIDAFAADFFQLSGVEAEQMDPQQRLFLECCWHALEDAGYAIEQNTHSCGVFVGASTSDYLNNIPETERIAQSFWGNSAAAIPARISYHLNLRGPAMTVDTACSSSLLAVHLACQSIAAGECDTAIAGGVFLMTSPAFHIQASNANMLSQRGLCSTFSDKADGFVPGEAVAAVVLKPLKKAIQDNDQIYAVIRASAVNQDGKSNGFTAPNLDAQKNLISELYAKHQINPDQISLIETHGTGTPLGDPIEVDALLSVYHGGQPQSCALGSVKTNVGHTATAAGITGLMKLIMALKYKTIPPSLHAETINPNIHLNGSPFYIPATATSWEPKHGSRMAAISSFGFSGTNVHLVLEEMTKTKFSNSPQSLYNLPVSAENEAIFANYISQILHWLEIHPDINIADLAYTLTHRRKRYAYGGIFRVSGLSDFKECLFNLIHHHSDHRFVLTNISNDHSFTGNGKTISLPAYPITQRSCWYPSHSEKTNKQVIELTISQSDTYIHDHVVNGHCIMPGVGYLNLLFNAVNEHLHLSPYSTTIDEIIFHQPLVVDAENLNITLILKFENGNWPFEFKRDLQTYCSGRFRSKASSNRAPDDVIMRENLSANMSAQQLYAAFQNSGIDYGSDMKPIQWVKLGHQESLALLDSKGKPDQFTTPAFLDGALQTLGAIIFRTPSNANQAACLPFIIEDIELYAPLSSRGFAHAIEIAKDEYQIQIFDMQKRPCALFKRILVRPMQAAPLANDWHYYHQTWIKNNLTDQTILPSIGTAIFLTQQHEPDSLRSAFQQQGCTIRRLVLVKSGASFVKHSDNEFTINPTASADYAKLLLETRDSSLAVFHHASFYPQQPLTVIAFLARACAGQYLAALNYIHFYQTSAPSALHSQMLEGFALCAGLELPEFHFQILGVDRETSELDALVAEYFAKHRIAVTIYKHGQRYIKQMNPLLPESFQPVIQNSLLAGANYVITGGLGGIGSQLAVDLAKRYEARILLIGRTISPEQQVWLNRVRQEHRIEFIQADVADISTLQRVFATFSQEHGAIHGIFHTAGSLHDSLILNIDQARIEASMQAKVTGTNHLLRLTQSFDIKLVVLFSSIVTALGNRGQALYASANAYMNHLAEQENGTTCKWVSINWPYWAHGGMQVNSHDISRMQEDWKLSPLANSEAFSMLESALHLHEPVIYIANDQTPFNMGRSLPVFESETDHETFLIQLLAQELKIPPERITPATTFDQLGLDSLLILDITRKLEKQVGKLPTTLLFEFKTIKSLAEHLDKNYCSVKQDKNVAAVEIDLPDTANGIAIIGLHGIYPKANDITQLWENLKSGLDCITEPPQNRFDYAPYSYGGFLDDIAGFDPQFFNITPREAEIMDPQERLFLEVAWGALENAGYTKSDIADFRTGVFVGVMYSLYQLYGAENDTVTNSSFASIANRLSYFLDAQGPSIAYDTMCSSSLTALHAACQSIRQGECEIAIVGGVNIASHPYKYAELLQKRMLAPDGRCRSFGAGGQGYVPGEGVGVVILKSLEAAMRDNDQILTVIRGSAIGHDGRTHGYTVPNPIAQSSVIERALLSAGIDAGTITYVEAHGTGTSLGDPIEIRGLQSAFASSFTGKQYCAIGSVKSNMGHLESAAGIAGLTKIILQMQHQTLVPTLHSKTINPNIDLSDTPFYLQHELAPWPQPMINGVYQPRRAGLSSFGAGGANAHVILEEAPAAYRRTAENEKIRKSLPPHVFQHKRYWIEAKKQQPESYYFYRKEWSRQPLAIQTAALSETHGYLILTTHDLQPEVERRLAPLVMHRDQCIYLVYHPQVHTWSMMHGGLINELQDEFSSYVLAYINSLHYELRGIFDFLDVKATEESAAIINQQRYLIWQQAVLAFQHANISLLHLTTGLTQGETYAGAIFASFIKTLAAENPQLIGKHIDFSDWENTDLAPVLALESTVDIHQLAVRYLQRERYIPQLHMQEKKYAPSSAHFDRDGLYVVTGGTRGLGAEVARYLVSRGVRHLLLTGKSPLPARETWDAILADVSAAEIKSKIQLIRELEAADCRVDLHFGEITDANNIELMLNVIKRRGLTIKGWIHCAGSTAGKAQSLTFKPFATVSEVLAPKTTGLLNLARALQHERPDFIVLFSSVSAIMPALSKGLGDYGAANAFMDDYGLWANNHTSTTCHVIQWPLWRRVEENNDVSRAYHDSGLQTLSYPHGLRILDSILQSAECMQGMPSTEILTAPAVLMQRQPARRQPAAAVVAHTVNATSLSTVVREVLHHVTKLSLDELDADRSFAEMGIDSILILELLGTLEKKLDIIISPTAIIDHDTINKLSSFLSSMPELKSSQTVRQQPVTIQENPSTRHTDIAVIGAAVNLPGAPDIKCFWRNLSTNLTSLSKPNDKRLNELHAGAVCKEHRAGYIDDVGYFDAAYFKFSEEQAVLLDPLCRHFLEVSVNALADAGYSLDAVSGKRVGVFAGARSANYVDKIKPWNKNTLVGAGQNFIAAHLSHFANWNGPSLVVDTACSSSLASIHLACQSLINQEADLAIAGGVDLLIDERPYELLAAAKALSPTGQCRPFDRHADGLVPGEGAAAVLLKPLDKALADGDNIMAVIQASAVNNDGYTMGYTTPNPEKQKDVILAAWKRGQVNPEQIVYLETHGTGTAIGDPIELQALTGAFREYTDRTGFCAVGSVKANIGHLLSAAGIASFVKAVLLLKHNSLPPLASCNEPNPRFDFEHSPLYLNRELVTIPETNTPLYAGISSFGFGGTNVHLVLRQFNVKDAGAYQVQRPSLSPVQFNKKLYWPNAMSAMNTGMDAYFNLTVNGA